VLLDLEAEVLEMKVVGTARSYIAMTNRFCLLDADAEWLLKER
jgi:hypothetical protein